MQRPWRFVRTYARAVRRSSSLLTLDVLSPAGRLRLHRFANEDRTPERPPALLETTLRELGISHLPIELREIDGADGNASVLEVAVLNALTKLYAPACIFEIGTFDGRTTLNLAANAPAGATVHTLDLPRDAMSSAQYALDENDVKYVDKAVSGARFRDVDGAPQLAGKIAQLWGDSATFDFTPYRGKVDFIFIDGSHAYEYVLSDSRNALQMLRGDRGVIVWHDYHSRWWPGVTRALEELQAREAPFARLRHVAGTTLAVLLPETAPQAVQA